MIIQVVSLSPGDTVSDAARIDLSRFRNGVGLLANVDSGAVASYTVQLTWDKIHWNNHDTLVNKTVSANGNLEFPACFVRLNGTVTNGSVTLGIVQAS